jgi:tetratricopeptide (TPR) repeat protein
MAGCRQIASLKAKMAFKDANLAYQAGDYKKAAAKYEEAIAQDAKLTPAYFYLANSYDNLYKPAKKGEAANDANCRKPSATTGKPLRRSPTIRSFEVSYDTAERVWREKLNDPRRPSPS